MRLYAIMTDFVHHDGFCSIDYFIDKYQVSKRTIQNDISQIMRLAPRNGFRILTKRGKGYLLEITNANLFDDFLESLNHGVSFNMKERPSQILAYLSIQNNYISMDTIADTFQISKTLVKSDMADVEKLANEYHLTLERKSHYGTRIVDNGNFLKKYLVDEYLGDNVFVETAVNDIVKDFSRVERTLIHQLHKEELNINYNELLNVVVYLKVMVYLAASRNENRTQDFVFSEEEPIDRITEYMIHSLEKMFDVIFSWESIQEFQEVLNKNVRKQMTNISFTQYLQNDIDDFLKNIDQTYETCFLEDHDFKKLLLTHVSLLIDRLHNKISYENPLANELSITYPMIFNIAILFCDMLKEKYGVEVTFDEIGFVATHFAAHMEKEKQLKLQSYNKIGVVCSSGGGSAFMIKMQIESLFPQANVKTFSFLQQDELQAYQPDLIFTVMPLTYPNKVPVIYIKELLDDKDLYRIKQILQCEEYDPYALINDDPLFYSFFSKEFFKIVHFDNYETLIKTMADELEEKGYGKKGFADMVMEREKFISTVYMNGICIPHPIETDAISNMISVFLLDEPFYWQGKEVKIVFMICLKKDYIEVYKTITKELYQLMKQPKYINRIANVQSYEEMIAIMKEMGGVHSE